mmetsp:Transcript_2338/g.5275  ORF Transcript_2338/g.5275 Transcript_2338/m.5275 type:complete len:210 (+) Transcript_2338:1836-2465(+)
MSSFVSPSLFSDASASSVVPPPALGLPSSAPGTTLGGSTSIRKVTSHSPLAMSMVWSSRAMNGGRTPTVSASSPPSPVKAKISRWSRADQISAVRFGGLEGATAGDASAVAAAAVGAEADSAALLAAAPPPAVVIASVSSPALGATAVAAPASGAAASSEMVAGAASSGDAIGSSQYRVRTTRVSVLKSNFAFAPLRMLHLRFGLRRQT